MQRRLPVSASREADAQLDRIDVEEAAGRNEVYFSRVVRSAREARALVLDLPLANEQRERALLVVSELVANAIVHAGGVRYLQIFHNDNYVRLEVADASPALPARAKVNLTSGRGLRMVDALATAWGWEPQPWGKVVWAEID